MLRDELPPVLTVDETASMLRISRGSAYEGVRTGAIPAIRVGRTWRVPRHALLAFLGNTTAEDASRAHAGRSQQLADGSHEERESDRRGEACG